VSAALPILLCALLGFAGGLGHLLVLRHRARRLRRPGAGPAPGLAALGVALPLLAAALALRLLPGAAWALLPGLLLARGLLLGPLAADLDADAPPAGSP
jgi:hypothetical protein